MPLVSIVLPVYNAENHLQKTLESISLSNFKDYELIICDDCSQDKTVYLANQFLNKKNDIDFKIIEIKKNSGVSFARNLAIKSSNGKYIALIDDDDLMNPNRIGKQVNFLESNPKITLVGTAQKMILPNKKWKFNKPLRNDSLIKASLFARTTILNPTIMFRAEFVKNKNIRYDVKYRFGEDYAFFLDICRQGGRFANINDVYDIYNLKNKKRWFTINDENMNLLRKKILKDIGLMPTERNIFYLNLLNFEIRPKELSEILGLIKFILRCTLKINNNYGGKIIFTFLRFKELFIIICNYIKFLKSNNI